MKIEIMSPTQNSPLPPVKWNFEQLKQEIQAGLSKYQGRVYTGLEIMEAKKDRALLNKLEKAIDEKRKEMKARYLEPYGQFEREAKELTGLIREQSKAIDGQIKAFDEDRKREKRLEIERKYQEMAGDLSLLIPYDRIHNEKWLNATYSLSAISGELASQVSTIHSNLEVIDQMGGKWINQTRDKYLQTLDLAKALAEKTRLEEQEQRLMEYQNRVSPPVQLVGQEKSEEVEIEEINKKPPESYQVDFRIWATREQLSLLKQFLQRNRIKYGKVE